MPLFPDKDRTPDEIAKVNRKFAKSDLGAARCPATATRIDAYSGGVNLLTQQEVYDSSLPAGVLPPAESRFDCFRTKFTRAARDGHRAGVQLHGAGQRPYGGAPHQAGGRRRR